MEDELIVFGEDMPVTPDMLDLPEELNRAIWGNQSPPMTAITETRDDGYVDVRFVRKR